MGEPSNYETSSTYVGGFVKALRAVGLLTPDVERRFGESQRAMVASAYSRGWWPGDESEKLARAALDVHGAAKLEEAGLLTTRNSVGPIITPLISVIGAIFGLKPSSLFERMGDLASTSVRGVGFEWKSTGSTSGTLRIEYPEGLGGATVEPLWRGACRYVFDTARAKGEIVSCQVDGSVLLFTLRW
jgi:hypothetical protein